MGAADLFCRYNLDLRAFIRDGGIDSELLAGTGDALAFQIVELAQKDKEADA